MNKNTWLFTHVMLLVAGSPPLHTTNHVRYDSLCSWLSSTVNQSPWIPQTHHGACQDRRTTDGCQSQVHQNQVGGSPVQVSTTHHIQLPVTSSSVRSMITLEYGLVHENTLSGQEPAQDSLQVSSCVVMQSHMLP